MKSKILGLLAVGLLAGPMAAHAVAFSIAGPGAANVDTNPGTQVVLFAGQSGLITDLNVAVTITGGHMEDFDLYLTSPDSTTVQFRANFWNPFVHIDSPLDAVFDDESATPHSAQSGGAIGTFQAWSLLSAFDGKQLSGNWTLTIQDTFVPGEGNTLVSWSIFGTIGTTVPEPGTLALLGLGLAGLGLSCRRKAA